MKYKMKNVLSAIFILIFVTSCESVKNIRQLDESTNSPRPLKIMTYNIRVGAGRNEFGRNPYQIRNAKYLDIKPIIETIKSIDPDIVGLQEVLGFEQLAEIGKALNMNYAYEPHSIDSYGSWWGVGILSKFPIEDVYSHEISSGRGNTKSTLMADVTVFGTKIVLISAHKDTHLRDGTSFQIIRESIKNIKDPIVLIADLNIWPDDSRHRILYDRLVDSALMVETQSAKFARRRGTFPGILNESWGKRIDYILVDKQYFNVLNAGLVNERYWQASDHLGYYTIVELK